MLVVIATCFFKAELAVRLLSDNLDHLIKAIVALLLIVAWCLRRTKEKFHIGSVSQQVELMVGNISSPKLSN